MSAALEASEVSLRIGSKALLDRVSLTLGGGESVALVGPNGAGKSTLLRVLSNELACNSGTIRLKGRAVGSYGAQSLALHRAVLSQNTAVTFPFSVREIVRMGAGQSRGAAIDRLADRALAEVDLEGFQDRIINTLSGGEQQRAHLARVLVQLACGEAANGPGVLLLDEPTASLDLRHQLDIVEAVHRRAADGSTVIAVLHDLNLATRLAGRIVVLDRGRVAAEGSPSATITDDMLARVYGIAQAVSRVPSTNVPFVLPHSANKTNGAGKPVQTS